MNRVRDPARLDLFSLPVADCPRPDFELAPDQEAGEPPEARGLDRDAVRLMVTHFTDDRVVHTRFRHIGDHLEPGDLLVINTSGTLPAALSVRREDGTPLELHLSTRLPADLWSVELREPDGDATHPFFGAMPGERLRLPGGGSARLLVPHRPDQREGGEHVRLWIATLQLLAELPGYLSEFGFPIRYRYVKREWPVSYYQTVYATEMGSAEMPSAGRAFTPQLLTQLMARGVRVAPLLLHTGVASLEEHEHPYEEYYRVPPATARAVNRARGDGRRVVAVGTTVVRALETVAEEDGRAHPGEGWTGLVVTPERGVRVIDGLLTGMHEPRATHLAMLEALAGPCHLQVAYGEARRRGYLWHEFGDLHLLLP